ncbi:hypothetical protein [Natrialba sp. INN-245]|uniref:hypothetical protein n=1 Tax=Natrialba sp. INN-245 TaxID=2690967 RepID=UPI0013126BF2|nr:hypothetical protein [Natrialba sp. INN-245]MWV40064.1 hypothetical protein [Natrialba sp. INN-245]
MTDPTTLADSLRTVGPGTRLELTWNENCQTTTTGVVTDFERGGADRRVETADRTLYLTHSRSDAGVTIAVTVTEITLEGVTDLGTLQELAIIDRPIETLRLTDAGVEVPPYYVGYEGFLTISDSQGSHDSRMLGGLDEYDDRLLTGFGPLPETYNEDIVEITPWGGPTRRFEIIDQRTPSEDSQPLAGPPLQATPTTARLAATRTDALDRAQDPNQDQDRSCPRNRASTDRHRTHTAPVSRPGHRPVTHQPPVRHHEQ